MKASFLLFPTILALMLFALPGLDGVSARHSARDTPDPVSPPGNIEHGRYLVERVAMCVECHSPRDESGNILEEQRFMGAPIPFRPPWPNDWAIRAPRNRGLPGYSVEQGIRLLTQGAIARDGHRLKLPMPRFRMTTQDAADVVAYMKSLQ